VNARFSRLLLATLVLAAPLAACGKKGQPVVPPGETNTYPRPYPSGKPDPTDTQDQNIKPDQNAKPDQ
jgi:predicted small lipoprotein YifL